MEQPKSIVIQTLSLSKTGGQMETVYWNRCQAVFIISGPYSGIFGEGGNRHKPKAYLRPFEHLAAEMIDCQCLGIFLSTIESNSMNMAMVYTVLAL